MRLRGSWTMSALRLFVLLGAITFVSGQPPPNRPLLIYNCAKMPSVCRNVNQRNPLQTIPGNAAAGNLGLLIPGQNGGQNSITLTFDTNNNSKRARRNAACPSKWKTQIQNACPKADQPPTVPSGSSWSSLTAYIGMRWNPNGLLFGQAGYNVIANQAQTGPSGMIWTCDEWPPALTVEGGQNALTYCAPQNGRCGGSQFGGTFSEQDIQGNIHSVLRKRITNALAAASPPAGQYPFSFQTAWQDNGGAPSAAVVWFQLQQTVNSVYKREIGQTLMYVDLVYENGSAASFARPLTETEEAEHTEFYKRVKRETEAVKLISRGNASQFPVLPPVQQRFETLLVAPPLPIIAIRDIFVKRLARLPFQSYMSGIMGIFQGAIPTTAVPQPIISKPIPTSSAAAHGLNLTRRTVNDSYPLTHGLHRRQAATCSAGNPCSDGSCCSSGGTCGYGPQNCGTGCSSNCGATANCGRDSLGGNVTCPLDVCCSYFGYCGVGTDFCSSPVPGSPCQAGFGSCSLVTAPACGGSSALGRNIAYYQVGNNYGRECQRISPAQINTAGLTHLFLAFASIDPATFAIVPTDARDVPYYTQFTALKTSTLQTWVSIGGWDFSDPGPTQSTFSQIVSTASNRAAFISSLKSFMLQYGFQGVDIDWEYPGAPDRDGVPSDTENFVSLLREMRASFGTEFGISATLPASYWYLRWFDPVAMEPFVDFFGLLAYDLHGPWDKTVVDVGPVIIRQTNIPELFNWTLPLWYDKVDPSKINMGLAYYGRGYTVESVDCTTVGCTWIGPSDPGPCTAFPGIMSLQEITNLIPQLGITPILDSTAMMKYLVWSNQWLGYDDLETIAMKKTWASSHCFGGTMTWSIDLFSGSGSGNTPNGNSTCSTGPGGTNGQSGSSDSGCDSIVFIDPSIWSEPNPVINCEPPCTFILPPLQLPTATTITFPPYVTSLDVAWSQSTGTSPGWTHIIQTTTLTIPPVTTTQIPVWEYTVTETTTVVDGTTTAAFLTYFPTSSILPPPFTITDDPNPLTQQGVTHPPVTRTITPPPYPYSSSTPSSNFPVITFKPGPPGPICKSGCGLPCLIFCNKPCLLDCIDGGNDFPDPIDPDPPARPTPKEENDPLPTGPTDPDPPDPKGDEPEDPEEEDEDDFCAYEFNLPPPVFVDPDSGANPTETISTASPTPTPHPTPNPTPPSPNPATESLHCYNSGASTDRASMIDGVNDFCNFFSGYILDDSDVNADHTLTFNYNGANPTGGSGAECFFTGICDISILLSVTVTSGCRFTVDGPSPSQDCGRIFREAIDKCDTSSTQYKQGGTVTSNCAIWRIDPNEVNVGSELL